MTLSQEQIKKFPFEYYALFGQDSYGTAFLFTEIVDGKEEFFIGMVDFLITHTAKIILYRLSYNCKWPASLRINFVFPTKGILISTNQQG